MAEDSNRKPARAEPIAVADIAAEPEALLDADAIRIGSDGDSRFLRSVLDVLPAALYATDAAGRVTYCNHAAIALAGREPRLGEDQWCVSWRLFTPDGAPLPRDRCPMAVALKENRAVRGVEVVVERPNGVRVPVLPYPTPLRDRSGRLVGAVNLLVELGDRKRAENVRAYLAAIVESSDDAIVSKDLNGIVTSWNRAANVIFGYSAEEMIGQPILRLFPPDRVSEEDVILSRIRNGEKVEHFETVRRRKDGVDIHVSLTISPVRDPTGRIIGVSKIARDITEQQRAAALLRDLNDTLERRVAERTRELAAVNEQLVAEMAERERTEQVLQQAQKMEVVGQLASGVAHDFNNLLAAILGNLELLEMRVADKRLLRLVQAATRSARHGARLNEQILAFSRKQHLLPRPVDVNALVTSVQALLSRTLGGTIELAVELQAGLWPALVDPHQLELVILNLAINARDAMPLGGRLTVKAANHTSPAGDSAVDLAPGEYVSLAVVDTGVGMSPDVLAHACEPFFTTKEPGKGSGLGLAQVYGLARQSGGALRITSAVGEGTTVELLLPRSTEAARPAAEPAESTAPGTAARPTRILVVDDHDEVREIVAAHLDTLGYEAVEASGGHAALALLRGNCDAFDLLIADFAMPGMGGIELVRAARVLCPELAVLVLTGYADIAGREREFGEAVVMHKPFRMRDLGAKVEQALRAQAGGKARSAAASSRPIENDAELLE